PCFRTSNGTSSAMMTPCSPIQLNSKFAWWPSPSREKSQEQRPFGMQRIIVRSHGSAERHSSPAGGAEVSLNPPVPSCPAGQVQRQVRPGTRLIAAREELRERQPHLLLAGRVLTPGL